MNWLTNLIKAGSKIKERIRERATREEIRAFKVDVSLLWKHSDFKIINF